MTADTSQNSGPRSTIARRWQQRLDVRLQRSWQRADWLSHLLLPLAWLHRGYWRCRRLAYQRGWATAERVPVPVLVVGNILVGGTGKTPTLIALVAALQKRGWRPGVVSRGYGVHIADSTPRVGQGPLEASRFGDEPALIARRTQAPVAVPPPRARAAQALCQAYPEIDVILADDGLQHLALDRQLELVVQDERGLGNGRMLPAGPLREPPCRLREVAAVVFNGTEKPIETAHYTTPASRHVGMSLVASHAIRLTDQHRVPLGTLTGQPVAAIAAIGQPQRFFAMLSRFGLRLTTCRALPDHDRFTDNPFADIAEAIILITDKDAVKCDAWPDPRVWRVPVDAQFNDPGFVDWLEGKLRACLPCHPQ